MNSQEYIEVAVKITPFSDENAEIATAEISELPFESFSAEEPYLKCYIQKELYDAHALKVVLGGVEGYGFDIEYSANLIPATNWNAVWVSISPLHDIFRLLHLLSSLSVSMAAPRLSPDISPLT